MNIEAFCASIVNRPVTGWEHPGIAGEWVVAFAGLDVPCHKQNIQDNIIVPESYNCVLRMKILKAGPIEDI